MITIIQLSIKQFVLIEEKDFTATFARVLCGAEADKSSKVP